MKMAPDCARADRRLALAQLAIAGMWPLSLRAQQDWPRKPVQVFIPYGPGGAVDVVIRVVAENMGQTLGQPLVIQNRPGGNANIAPGLVAQAAADGYSLLASSTATVLNPLVERKLSWSRDSFVPIARLATSPSLIVVPSSAGIRTLAEFVARAKAQPGKLTTPVTGFGSAQAVARESFARAAGIQLLDVAYKGGVSFVADLISGTLSMSVSPVNVVMPMVRDGQLVALAQTGARRSPLAPDLPTLVELGYPEATSISWFGLHAPAATPAGIIEKLSAAARTAVADPGIRNRLIGVGVDPGYLDATAFTAFMEEETVKARRYVASLPADR